MPSSALPELPLPFVLPAVPATASHRHVIVPYAALSSSSCQHVLAELVLPHLEQLLHLLAPDTVDEGSADGDIPPHERVVARAWGLDPQAPAWAAMAQAAAQPVPCAWMTLCHWTTGADQVRMDDPAQLPLDATGAQALLALLQPWFEEDGMQLHLNSPGRWRVSGAPLADVQAASLDRVLLRDVSRWLPEGSQRRLLHRLHSEVQMLLYTHPFNAQRTQLGLPPINAFWLHGAGALDDAQWQSTQALRATQALELIDTLRQSALRLDWAQWKQAWLQADAGPLRALLAHVQQGGSATLTLCGERNAHSFTSRRRGWIDTIKNHFNPQRFAGLHQAL